MFKFKLIIQYLRRQNFSSDITDGTKMFAIQFNAIKKNLQLIEKPIPEQIDDNQVLIKVAYAGICGTDLHIIDGEFPCKRDGPLVLGHEFSGVVQKIGNNIKNIKIGDRVVTDPNRGCMACDYCRIGNVHYCKNGGLNTTIGIFNDGGWSQYCLVPDVQVHKIPDSITLEQAALAEPMSCISHTWDLISPVPIGHKILIIGSGIIGNLFVSLLHLQGHKRVTISEPSEQRKKLVEGLGTDYEIITPDTLKARQNSNDSYVFNLIVDCSGNAQAIEHAFNLLDFGGKLCIFGVANPAATISISPFQIFKKELTILGTTINPFTFPKSLAILESMGDKYINYEKLGIKTFALTDYEAAIENLKKGTIAKAVFKM